MYFCVLVPSSFFFNKILYQRKHPLVLMLETINSLFSLFFGCGQEKSLSLWRTPFSSLHLLVVVRQHNWVFCRFLRKLIQFKVAQKCRNNFCNKMRGGSLILTLSFLGHSGHTCETVQVNVRLFFSHSHINVPPQI